MHGDERGAARVRVLWAECRGARRLERVGARAVRAAEARRGAHQPHVLEPAPHQRDLPGEHAQARRRRRRRGRAGSALAFCTV